jgi:hypothetical protein
MPTIDPHWLLKNNYEAARFAHEGETLWGPVLWSDGSWHLITGKVACAAGNSARIVNEKRMLNRWFDVWEIYRETKEQK